MRGDGVRICIPVDRLICFLGNTERTEQKCDVYVHRIVREIFFWRILRVTDIVTWIKVDRDNDEHTFDQSRMGRSRPGHSETDRDRRFIAGDQISRDQGRPLGPEI